jgi:outer membrane immunogenic protein
MLKIVFQFLVMGVTVLVAASSSQAASFEYLYGKLRPTEVVQASAVEPLAWVEESDDEVALTSFFDRLSDGKGGKGGDGKGGDGGGKGDDCCESKCCCYDWSGFYVGGQVGGAWLLPNTDAANFIQPNSSGFVGGGFVGINRQYNRMVLGIEADFNVTGLDETVPCFNPAFSCNAASDWNTSIRGRLGIARNRVLYFGTGGYAAADFDGNTTIVATGTTFPDGGTLSGFSAGGGIEYAWTDNILVRVEYRYSGFGRQTMVYDVPYAVSPGLHMALTGVSWKF